MTRILIAAGLLVTLAGGSATAADLQVKARPALAPVYNWSGCYAGLHAGGGWGYQDWNATSNTTAWGDFAPGEGFSQSVNGLVGGGQLGCNQQFGQWVVGIEGTLSGVSLKGDYLSVAGVGDDFFATKISTIASVTARFGFARDNWLIYGKAGYAGARINVSVVDNVAPSVGSGDTTDWNSGWIAGAGIEYGLTTNIVLGVEYNYLRLGAHNSNLASLPVNYGWDVTTHIDTVLARISYKFGSVPLAAKY